MACHSLHAVVKKCVNFKEVINGPFKLGHSAPSVPVSPVFFLCFGPYCKFPYFGKLSSKFLYFYFLNMFCYWLCYSCLKVRY